MTQDYHFAQFQLLPDQRSLCCGGAPVKLGSRAFDMLLALLERRDRVVSKQELMDLVWPRLVVEENNLQVQVAALRKLLGHPAIATVPGRGYRFTLPVQVQGGPVSGNEPPAAAAAQPPSPGLPRHNLPPWLPRLFGRADDLLRLGQLLDLHPLVTVTGSGGIGKTLLARAAAAQRLPHTPDGLWWVDLAVLSEPQRVADAVALTLGLRPGPGQTPDQALVAALAGRSPLLVLDNAEHVLDGVAALITQLRQAAPQARWLITSQEALHLADEHVFRVGALALPTPSSQHRSAEEAGGDDDSNSDGGAVALFVARAQAADRHFVLSPDKRALVADICRRLDGNPLAIELAAARLPMLGVQGLHDRLDQRLKVLTSGDRAAARRHHTLRAALEWSHQLLAPPEQAVLRRLGVFAGGFTLQAAQQVAEDEQGLDAWEVLEHLGALVDKSMVVAEGEAQPRYRMLETMRLFALERLIESGEAPQARGRHREHYLALAEEALPRMVVADPRGLAALDGERDNLFLALAWSEEDASQLHGLRLAAAMRYYWTSRGLLARGLHVALQALARPGAQAPSSMRCTVQATAAQLCSWMGQHDEALRHGQAALVEARNLGDQRCLCGMLSALGFLQLARSEVAPARQVAEEALVLGRTLGDSHELGNALALMAAVHRHSDEDNAALSLLHEGVALRRRMHQPWSEAVGHLNLAQFAIDRGRVAEAGPHLRRVQALLPRIDSQHIGLYLIGMSAEWAAASGQHQTAVLLDAACARQQARVGMASGSQPEQDHRLQAARQALEAGLCEQLQASGRSLSYSEALAQVREFLGPDAEDDFSIDKA